MLWSILILTQPSRTQFLARLLGVLKPQIESFPDVEILIRQFNPSMDLGANRQAMIEGATGTYISQIDDDDLVPASYVSTIYPLLDGVDYIGHRVQLYIDGEKQQPTFHSLRYNCWNADSDGWYRDISHVNPIRRELALAVPMSGGHGEDDRWATGLRNLGIVKTEHYVDAVMYLYYFRSNKTDHSIESAHQVSTNILELRASQPRSTCPSCGSAAVGMAGGMRRCNQCAHSWI
jgi:hypothetical protein